jgi:hypothetical protein
MKRSKALLMIAVSLLLVFLPVAMSGAVFAQTSGYTITQVNHQIQVLYSGQVIIQDTVYVSGQVTNGFTVGLPAQYSAEILNAVAYDSTHIYQVTLGAQLGSQSGFYGAEVNFNGQTPSVFTVAFVLSSATLTQESTGSYTLNFPAYPGLTESVGSCNVTLTFPSIPTSIVITKTDGTVNTENYVTPNLPAYTFSPASASFQLSNETIQKAEITNLDRQISFDPTGQVSASDTYRIVNNGTSSMQTFLLDLPSNAKNVAIKDAAGNSLAIAGNSIVNGALQENTTLITVVATDQSTTLTASYNLPAATIKGSQYTISNFELFPYLNYFVEQASVTFNPPQGATIVTPQLSSIDVSSTLTRSAFQDTLTLTGNGISFLNYILSQSNTIQFAYTYNPIWVSFMPTFWLSFIAVIGCIGAVVYQKRKPGEKQPVSFRKVKASTPKPIAEASVAQEATSPEPRPVTATAQRLTSMNVREFTESYEDKKRLHGEIRSLDQRAQKGKIPRRQYKVQRAAIESRLETLSRNTEKTKEILRNSGGVYPDLIKQLDSAEEDLSEAEEDIKNLEDQQSRGEISLEAYKKDIGDYQKHRDKTESTLNGILLRLREKSR